LITASLSYTSQLFHLENSIGELLLPPETTNTSSKEVKQNSLFGDTIAARAFNDTFETVHLMGKILPNNFARDIDC
jgi:hypothetical protein